MNGEVCKSLKYLYKRTCLTEIEMTIVAIEVLSVIVEYVRRDILYEVIKF